MGVGVPVLVRVATKAEAVYAYAAAAIGKRRDATKEVLPVGKARRFRATTSPVRRSGVARKAGTQTIAAIRKVLSAAAEKRQGHIEDA